MKLIKTIKNLIWPIGFHIEESMVGTHRFLLGTGPKGEFPMHFDVVWSTDDITKKGPMSLRGEISIGGLCEKVKCWGTLELNYLSENKLRYTIYFQPSHTLSKIGYGEYIYVGEKVNIKPWNLLVSHTTCYGTLIDFTGKLVSRSVTHFKLNTIPAFLKSFRPFIGNI